MAHDITKLPKWAQQRIEKLEKDVEHYRAKAYRVGGDEPTDTILEPYGDLQGDEPRFLPKGSLIRFKTGERRDRYVDIRALDHCGAVEIHGATPLNLEMKASNILHVKVKDR